MSIAVSGNYYGAGSGVDGYAAKFIPAIWSGKLQEKFYPSTCLSEIANSDWAGEIKDQGDKVEIRTVPNITISDYQKGMTLATQVPAAAMIELLIDKGKYFNLVVDDVDAIQSDLRLMDMFSTDAAEQMKISIETMVLDGIVAKLSSATTQSGNASSQNMGNAAGAKSANIALGATGAPVAITKANVLDVIVDTGQVLDEQNAPESNRWVVIPPWMAALIKKSDLKDASLSGDGTSLLRNGRIGSIDRYNLFVNNNLKVTTTDGAFSNVAHILFGCKQAICFASQFTKMETMRAQTTFGNIIRGVQVFGYEVTKADALGRLYAYKG